MGSVIIAGAGIIGLSCAWRLSQRGHGVVIFDAGRAGGEASWAGAGMLAPGGEVFGISQFSHLAVSSLRRYPEFVRELTEESGLAIDFRISGAVEVAFDEEQAAELDRKAELQSGLGIPSESISSSLGHFHSRLYPEDAQVDPRDITAALRTACERRGVIIHENEPVLEVLDSGRGVRTLARDYPDDQGVLIAAGAWSSALVPQGRATRPVRGHLIAFDLEPGRLKPILRHGHTYILQRQSGRMIAGSTTEEVGFDRTLDLEAIDDVQRRAERLLPNLRGLVPSARWNGFRPGIEGEVPSISRVAGTRLWTAYGHYRNGILLAPETAARIAELVP